MQTAADMPAVSPIISEIMGAVWLPVTVHAPMPEVDCTEVVPDAGATVFVPGLEARERVRDPEARGSVPDMGAEMPATDIADTTGTSCNKTGIAPNGDPV